MMEQIRKILTAYKAEYSTTNEFNQKIAKYNKE